MSPLLAQSGHPNSTPLCPRLTQSGRAICRKERPLSASVLKTETIHRPHPRDSSCQLIHNSGLRTIMPVPTQPIIATRHPQMFPTLELSEVERVRRFGAVRSYGVGEALVKVGDIGHGLTIVLAGYVDITQHDQSGKRTAIVTHGPGNFMGELAQLAGRPALVDGYAQGPVEALIIPPDSLRAMLVAEAELGERIMRALILRRVGLLETGAGGPVIVGRNENGDVLRLVGFLRRNGHPHQTLNPETDPEAKALIERFHVDPGQLPIVLCPGGQMLRNPARSNSLAASGWSDQSIRIVFMMWSS